MDANLLPCIVADILTLIYVVSLAVPGIEELETALSLAGIHGLCVQKARRPYTCNPAVVCVAGAQSSRRLQRRVSGLSREAGAQRK